jgi:sugar (glycoside-pentoside-hexuronide) transporter
MKKETIVLENEIAPAVTAVNSNITKIKFGEKAAYFSANLSSVPMLAIIGTFLLIFYTDVVGLNPAAVGVLFLLARLMDAISDPIMGYLIDHLPRTKWGRFRPWLVVGAFIATINFVLVWIGPSMATSGKLVIAYITYLLLGITFDIMDISLTSLLPTMTESNKERNTLSSIRGLGFLVGVVISSIFVVPFVALFPTQKEGYHMMVIVVAVFIFLMALIGAMGVHERVNPVEKEHYSVSMMLKILFKTKPFFILMVCATFVSIGQYVRNGATMYYLTYAFNNPELMVPYMAVGLLFTVVAMIAAPYFANRFEMKNVMFVAIFIYGLGMIALFLVPYGNVTLLLVTNIFASIGSGIYTPLYFTMQADLVDIVEWKHNYRAEGAVASIGSFIAKAGQAFGAAMPAFILAATGYVANAPQQSPQTLLGIKHAMSTIPFGFTLVSALLFLAYPITRSVFEKVTKELQIRAENAAAEQKS